MRSKRIGARVAVAVCCFVALAMPLLFVFARSGASPGVDVFGSLYSSLVVLFGEWQARLLFCGAWLAIDAAVVSRLLLSKRKDVDASPIEGLGD